MATVVNDEVETLVKVYNRFVTALIQDVSESQGDLKAKLKSLGVSAIAPASHTHIKNAAQSVPRAALAAASVDDVISSIEGVGAFEPIKGLSMAGMMSGHETSGSEPDWSHEIKEYLYVLSSLAATYSDCLATPEGAADLASAVLHALSKAQLCEEGDINILDDELSSMLERVLELSRAKMSQRFTPETQSQGQTQSQGRGPEPPAKDDVDVESLLKSLENSKIADLAKEISSEIDIGELGGNPMEMLNFANLTDSNSVLGSIVSKVGSKIQTKLSSGEMKQEELVSEAVSLLKALDSGGQMANNPMFGSLFKAAKSGKLAVNTANLKTSSARERLRKKLEKQREREAAGGAAK